MELTVEGLTAKEFSERIMRGFGGNGGFVIEQEIVDWFNDNYTEPEETIRHIITEACKNHACTPAQLREACGKLKENKDDKTPLKALVELLSILSDVGMRGATAGTNLRNAIKKIGAFDLLYKKTTKDMGKALSATIKVLNSRL